MGANLARSRREQVGHPTHRSTFLSGFESLETLRPAMGMCRHKGNSSFVCKYEAHRAHIQRMHGCCSCSCLNPHRSFSSLYHCTSTGIVSFPSLPLFRFGLSILSVESWIFSFADLKSVVRPGCWFDRLLCAHSAFIVLSFLFKHPR